METMELERAILFLDSMPPRRAKVGWGTLGRNGSLGYEGKRVMAGGRTYENALSAHPPSSLLFDLDGRFASFHCQVAINDDVPAGITRADFTVLADGQPVAAAVHVVAGEPPRTLSANLGGARRLELRIDSALRTCCHAVWLEPRLELAAIPVTPGRLSDCLSRTEILLPAARPQGKRCIATVVSPGFEANLDDLLGSLYANGGCQDAVTVVFAVGDSPKIDEIAAKYRVSLINCRAQTKITTAVKSVLYSVARVVDADKFLCLDADMLVLGDLNPLFVTLDACSEGSILVCRDGNENPFKDLNHILCTAYGGKESDLARLLGDPEDEGQFPLIVNDGLMAGSRSAMLALDQCIRSMSQAAAWHDEQRNIVWRNQFVLNLALARLRCAVELNPVYNLQLHAQDVEMRIEAGRVRARWRDREVRLLHFSANGRSKYPKFRNLFASVPDPLAEKVDGDAYGEFLAALRVWIGRFGLSAAAWSFYGTSDGVSAWVRDASTFPLLALLHYLVRSNGCIRVLESGTARGISAACLASAVAHREGGRVVTLDPAKVDSRRNELWAGLPERIRSCIEPRAVGSLEGMAAALAAGERYEAALLDSIHTEEHVWQEFELARQLVCPGGLILIHDPCFVHGTVEGALARIAAEGYGVTRLWAAESGVQEDDRLGLAVIENRRRSPEGALA